MTDVRERVATLLFEHDHPEGNWSAYISWTDDESKAEVASYRTKADSVLSELGWEEIVGGLFPDPVKQSDGHYVDDSADFNLDAALINLKQTAADEVCIRTVERVVQKLRSARSALSRARGETK